MSMLELSEPSACTDIWKDIEQFSSLNNIIIVDPNGQDSKRKRTVRESLAMYYMSTTGHTRGCKGLGLRVRD